MVFLSVRSLIKQYVSVRSKYDQSFRPSQGPSQSATTKQPSTLSLHFTTNKHSHIRWHHVLLICCTMNLIHIEDLLTLLDVLMARQAVS